jgi:hypothetical protein
MQKHLDVEQISELSAVGPGCVAISAEVEESPLQNSDQFSVDFDLHFAL